MQKNVNSLLVLGGARSGKSRFAESLAAQDGRAVTFIATAQAGDAEMAARIAHHQKTRPAGFLVVEEPLALVQILETKMHRDAIILVDCLTLWLTNVMLAGRDVEAEGQHLCAVLVQATSPVLLVSNEVGQGIVPETPLGRAFRDAQGRLNAQIAQVVDGAVLMVAGLPLWLKPGATSADDVVLR